MRQLYNLAWLQAALRLACRLPRHVRHQLRDEWNQRVRLAESQAYTKVDTVALGIGLVSAVLDACGIFNDDVDYPRHTTTSKLGHNISLEELEAGQLGALFGLVDGAGRAELQLVSGGGPAGRPVTSVCAAAGAGE